MTNVANQVDEMAFLLDYRRGTSWEELRRRFRTSPEKLRQILADWQEPERPPLQAEGRVISYYTLELANGKFAKIRM